MTALVNKFEFSKVLRELDLNLLESQFSVLNDAYDLENDGNIHYLRFLGKIFSLIYLR